MHSSRIGVKNGFSARRCSYQDDWCVNGRLSGRRRSVTPVVEGAAAAWTTWRTTAAAASKWRSSTTERVGHAIHFRSQSNALRRVEHWCKRGAHRVEGRVEANVCITNHLVVLPGDVFKNGTN